MNPQPVLIWDLPTRLTHWLLAGSFTTAYLTAEAEGWENVHYTAGFTVMGLVLFRLMWGVMGSRYARFRQFCYRPGQVLDYLRSLTSQPTHYTGHNPLGSLAIFALLGLGLATTCAGALMYASGSEFLEEPHELFANLMLLTVILHIAGVVTSGKLHGENLSRAMVTGQKAAYPSEAIPQAHPLVAAVLLATVLGFWTYTWQHPFAGFEEAEEEHSGQHADDDAGEHEE